MRSTDTTVLRDVEVEGSRVDVRLDSGVVVALGRHLSVDGARVIDGAGGALLPGLHDHHLHLLAMAAAADSVDCSPSAVRGAAALGAALRAAVGASGWVRGVGYHEDVAGPLDRHVLDELAPGRRIRVQHRSGSLWMLSSPALEAVAPALDHSNDVERDAGGEPNGRLWRYDARLRAALPRRPPDLATVGRKLARLGVTGVTDATPNLDDGSLDLLVHAVVARDLPQTVLLLGAPADATLPERVAVGPWKVLLRDHDLPSVDQLIHEVRTQHDQGRPVAVHCVTADALVLTLAALDAVGPLPGDRIEHAAVVPPGLDSWLVRSGARVVTQPDFLRTRGDAYLRDLDPLDTGDLYRYGSLREMGVPVCPSSDAPFGEADPWQVIASAVQRGGPTGPRIGPRESTDALAALEGYLSSPTDPGGAPKRIRPGDPADLVLLDVPLATALSDPDARHVRSTWIAGMAVVP